MSSRSVGASTPLKRGRLPGAPGSAEIVAPWFGSHPRVAAALTAAPYLGRVAIERTRIYAARAPLDAVVCVPVKDEATRLPATLAALELAVQNASAVRCGIVLIVNNARDRSADVIVEWARTADVPTLVCEVSLTEGAANVSFARRIALDIGEGVARQNAVLLSTDADTVVAPDWIETLVAAVRGGAALAVGGIEADGAELVQLPEPVHVVGRVEAELFACYEAIWQRINPGPPCPMLMTANGASMAVSAAAYRAIGGLPTDAVNEDRALFETLTVQGFDVRRVDARAVVSCRLDARAAHGMADTLATRCTAEDPMVDSRLPPLVTFILRTVLLWRLSKGSDTELAHLATKHGLSVAAERAAQARSMVQRAAIIANAERSAPLTLAAAKIELSRARQVLSALQKSAIGDCPDILKVLEGCDE